MSKELKNGLVIAVITAALSIFGTISGAVTTSFLAAQNAAVEFEQDEYKNKLDLRSGLLRDMLSILSSKGYVQKLYEDVATYSELVSGFSGLVNGDQDKLDELISFDEILADKSKEFTELYHCCPVNNVIKEA